MQSCISLILLFAGILQLCDFAHASNVSYALQTSNIGAKGFVVDLGYDGLVATLYIGDTLDGYGSNPDAMWSNIARQIQHDANSPPYSFGGTTDLYDVWPKLTLREPKVPIEPSWLVRFSLRKAPDKCATRPVDQKIVNAVGKIFQFMASLNPKPDFAFSGKIGTPTQTFYLVRLVQTGSRPARREKRADISPADLQVINQARQTVISQTRPNDIIIYVGSSASYFYYAMNRPGDPRTALRNVHLLPVSAAQLWTEKTPLDLLQGKDEYRNFVKTQLAPIIRSRPCIGRCRLIWIDYTRGGFTVYGLRWMMIMNNLWSDDQYLINIESPDDPHGQPPVPRLQKMKPIIVLIWPQLEALADGGLGRIVPPYPWYYWDVPPEYVWYPEKSAARAIINIIRQNRLPGYGDSSNMTSDSLIGTSESTAVSILTKPPGSQNATHPWPYPKNDTSTTDENRYAWNNNINSVPEWPTIQSASCLEDGTGLTSGVTTVGNVKVSPRPYSSIIYPSEMTS